MKKIEKQIIVLFAVLGICIGLGLSHSTQNLQRPILEIGLISMIGFVVALVAIEKRDNYQNK